MSSAQAAQATAPVAAYQWALQGEVSIYHAAQLREALAVWLAQAPEGAPVQLEMSGVTELDGAGVQLLLSTFKTAQLQNLPLQLVGASAAVQEVLQVLQLHQWCRHDVASAADAAGPKQSVEPV